VVKNRREYVSKVIKSVQVCALAATRGLDDNIFDLWTNLYGFIVKGIEEAISTLGEVK
jgi:hypothetical protein